MIHDTQSAQISQKQDGRKYIYNHENNVPSRSRPQWLCGNSCTWGHDVRLHIAGLLAPMNQKVLNKTQQGSTIYFFTNIYIYIYIYTHKIYINIYINKITKHNEMWFAELLLTIFIIFP